MKRYLNIIAFILGVSLTLGMTAYAFANIDKADMMMGIMASEKNASLQIEDQPGASGEITVAKVVAPAPSWVVVHLDDGGKPGMRVGVQQVPAGTSENVRVKLDDEKLSDKLIVALHYDGGVQGTFEFDMEKFDQSPDRPYFVNGMELAKTPRVK